MKHPIFLLALGLITSGCTRAIYIPPAPLPELPKEVRTKCEPLPRVEVNSVEMLGKADKEAAKIYKACQDRHVRMVVEYEDARLKTEALILLYSTKNKKK